jgi:hypothetical protein
MAPWIGIGNTLMRCGGAPAAPHVFVLGETYGGGIVVWIALDGLTALVAADVLLSTATWGCSGTNISGTSLAVGTGQANTNLILAGCATAGIAARICDSYTSGGFTDWYLPSSDELRLVNAQVASFTTLIVGNYWSSSQWGVNDSYYTRPLTNYTDITGKAASNPFLPFRLAGQYD